MNSSLLVCLCVSNMFQRRERNKNSPPPLGARHFQKLSSPTEERRASETLAWEKSLSSFLPFPLWLRIAHARTHRREEEEEEEEEEENLGKRKGKGTKGRRKSGREGGREGGGALERANKRVLRPALPLSCPTSFLSFSPFWQLRV